MVPNDFTTVKSICGKLGNDRGRMMDIVREVQQALGSCSEDAIDAIAQCVAAPRVEVESVVSFYAFYSKEAKGKIVIRLCNDIVDKLQGFERVAKVVKEELGIGCRFVPLVGTEGWPGAP